jgi:hypothetical protein
MAVLLACMKIAASYRQLYLLNLISSDNLQNFQTTHNCSDDGRDVVDQE